MNKKLKLLAALPIVALFSLTSCDDGATTSNTINVWTGFGDSMTTQLENILTDYEASHEGLDIVHTGQGGYDNLLAAIVGSVSTRTYPQLAVAYPDHMAQYQESGILFDLTSTIEADGMDLNKFFPNYLEENLQIVPDHVMGLPFNKSTEVMTTNQDFIDILIKMTETKEGADKITGVPTTWQEVETFGLAARKALDETNAWNKVIGEDGKVYSDAIAAGDAGVNVAIDLTNVGSNDFYVLSYDSQANFFITMVRQWGGTYTSVEEIGNGKTQGYMQYKSQEVVDMLKFFNRLFNEGIIGIPSFYGEASYTSTPFKAYKTIFTIGSSAGVSNCVDGDKINVQINPIPYNADKPEFKYVISQGTNLVMFKNADEENRKNSFELLKTLAYDADTNATFAKNTGYIPVTTDAYESTIYQNYLNDSTLTGTAKTMRDAVKTNFDVYQGNQGWTQYVDPGFVGSSSIRANVTGIMEECAGVSLEDGAKDDTWYDLLDRYYQLNPSNIPA